MRSGEAARLGHEQGQLQRTHAPILQLRDAAQVRGRPDAGLGTHTARVHRGGAVSNQSHDSLLDRCILGNERSLK